ARVGLGSFRATAEDGTVLEDRSEGATDTALSMVQLDLRAGGALRIDLDPGHEHGLPVDCGGARLEAEVRGGGQGPAAARARGVAGRGLVVLPAGARQLPLRAEDGAALRAMLLGGEPLDEEIIMWWNFVGRTHEEVVQFRARYQAEIGVELPLSEAPIAAVARERGGLAADDERFGPCAPHTPQALPAPQLPHGHLT